MPGLWPCLVKSSDLFSPNALTRMRTQPGSGFGTGRWMNRFGQPNQINRIEASIEKWLTNVFKLQDFRPTGLIHDSCFHLCSLELSMFLMGH